MTKTECYTSVRTADQNDSTALMFVLGDFCTDVSLRHERMAKLLYRGNRGSLHPELFNTLVQQLEELSVAMEGCPGPKGDSPRQATPISLLARLGARLYCEVNKLI